MTLIINKYDEFLSYTTVYVGAGKAVHAARFFDDNRQVIVRTFCGKLHNGSDDGPGGVDEPTCKFCLAKIPSVAKQARRDSYYLMTSSRDDAYAWGATEAGLKIEKDWHEKYNG